MEKNDRYTSLIWAAFGFYIAFEGYQLKIGILSNPESGFLLFWAGIVLSTLSFILFILTFFSKKEEKKILWRGLQWPKGIKLMVSLFVFVLVFRWMGFLLSTFLLLLFLFKGLESQRWRTAFLLSIITIVLCYLIFGVFLETRFPEGILEKIVNLFHR